jgi:SAM-dependent methyltransferase
MDIPGTTQISSAMPHVHARGAKELVRDFWESGSCGEHLYLPRTDRAGYRAQAEERYRLEPYIARLAKFGESQGKRVLEIGVGLGADHQRFAEHGAILEGIDLTERAIAHTRVRLDAFSLTSRLQVADAEALPFADNQFEVVYSWGVLHHSPDTPKAFREVLRVLEPGGEARIMIYHTLSMVGVMLWIRYSLLRGRPWRSLRSVYAEHLESPGTKAYTVTEARALLDGFEDVRIEIELTHGDLLESQAGQRHKGPMLSLARKVWPRRIIRKLLPNAGLFMLISARKPAHAGGADAR